MYLIDWLCASHQHAFSPDCLLAASPMTQITTATRPSTPQHLLSSRWPRHPQPPSPFCLCKQGSRPKKKSSPAGWPYSSACWLLVSCLSVATSLYICLTQSFFILFSVAVCYCQHKLLTRIVFKEVSSLVSFWAHRIGRKKEMNPQWQIYSLWFTQCTYLDLIQLIIESKVQPL